MAKGGSRWGAGRPGWHVKGEQCRRLDIRHLHRSGLLRSGRSGEWCWDDSGCHLSFGAVVYSVVEGNLLLVYWMQGIELRQCVPLLFTPCRFGGCRPWFGCPGCQNRVAVLYARPGGFRCRACGKVVFASQSEGLIDRAWRRQRKLEQQLSEHLARPKGMREETYLRLLLQIRECEDRRDRALAASAAREFPELTQTSSVGDECVVRRQRRNPASS